MGTKMLGQEGRFVVCFSSVYPPVVPNPKMAKLCCGENFPEMVDFL